jgi:hypothetical protein
MLAPSFARLADTAAPIPDEAPMMTATLPARRPILALAEAGTLLMLWDQLRCMIYDGKTHPLFHPAREEGTLDSRRRGGRLSHPRAKKCRV